MTVAVVTGAARGVGRGIALVLGELGATVYVTDRETRAHRHSDLGGAIEDTAEEITALGGHGIAIPHDHHDDPLPVFDRVRSEHGGVDLVVANACNGNARPFHPGPFWTLAPEHWDEMLTVGVRSHLATATRAAPLLIERRGLLVLTGYKQDDDPSGPPMGGHVYYDLAMTAVNRLASTLAHDLRPHGVTALALSPGFTRTEAIVAVLGPNPSGTDPVDLPGRAVRALLADPDVARHSGTTLTVAAAAELYDLQSHSSTETGT